MTLSDTQQEALEKMKANGGVLRRLPGGLWTWPGCPNKEGSLMTPEWWCGTTTVRAMIQKGVVFASDLRSWGPIEVKLSTV